MDAKALAKSKRAHTQHHKKHHPNQKSRPSPVSASDTGGTRKSSGNQAGEKRTQKPRLPSNWDRYEELDSGLEDPSGATTSLPTDVVLPNSKGADYRHLISEAQSQSHLTFTDGFPSIDDAILGNTWGLGDLLSVRGEGILSWVGDDNFVVDDKAGGSHEASLLSLNLCALAEQLEKVDASERLYLEADIIPRELHSKSGGDPSTEQAEITCKSKVVTSESEESASVDDKNFDSSGSCHGDPILSRPVLILSNQANVVKSEVGTSNQNRTPSLTTHGSPEVAPKHCVDNKLPTFEATAAEAELDMLLGSFTETKLNNSLGTRSSIQQEAPIAVPQHSGKSVGSAFSGVSIDDDLDNLLEETSNLMKQNSVKPGYNFQSSIQASVASPQGRKGPYTFGSKSFDTNMDDAFDVLLEETSNSGKQNSLPKADEINALHHDSLSSSSSSKSKALADFDSWLDTI